MNETVFREILGESLKREYAEFDNAPEHKFSLKHRLAMKRVFARFERNARKLGKKEIAKAAPKSEYEPSCSLKQRLLIALVVIILMTLLAGWFIPMHRITLDQLDLLRSRYDFSTMKMSVRNTLANDGGQTQYGFKPTAEYSSFLEDLEYMGIYSAEELNEIKTRALPLDTRPESYPTYLTCLTTVYSDDLENSGDSPLDIFREFVSNLENMFDFYDERSKDPSRAVAGDAEFAALIKERFLPLPKNFFEFLSELFCNEDENLPQSNDVLSDFDKDDKMYLFKINEI